MTGRNDDLNPRFWPWVEGDTRRDPGPGDGPTLAELDAEEFHVRRREQIAAGLEDEGNAGERFSQDGER